jgi:type III restriction enzyme
VRTTDGAVWIVETKGREELDLPQKMARCVNGARTRPKQPRTTADRYHFVYVDQQSFEQHKPSSFAGLVSTFREYQEG